MMNLVEPPVAIRAYAVPMESNGPTWDGRVGWRAQPHGARVLVFDTETTVDAYQNLLIGSFLVLEKGETDQSQAQFRIACLDPMRPFRGLILGDTLGRRERSVVRFAEERLIQIIRRGYARSEPAAVLTRDQFVHEVFYPEVFELGAVCVGYNLGFDLVRLAIRCTVGREHYRDAFRIEFCRHSHHPAVRLQILSNKQSFIRFSSVPPPQGRKRKPGRLTFQGRFLDLRQAVYALAGDSSGLEADCAMFGVGAEKLTVSKLGTLTRKLIDYNVQDTEVLTAGLFTAVWQAFLEHPDIVTTDSEYDRRTKRRPTDFYSPATIGKAHLDAMGILPPQLVLK